MYNSCKAGDRDDKIIPFLWVVLVKILYTIPGKVNSSGGKLAEGKRSELG